MLWCTGGREGGGSAAVHSVLWCTGGWLRRWWISGSPRCVVVYRWLVEKVVGQWQCTVCCGVQVVEKVVGQRQSTVCCGVQVVG